MTPRNQLAAFVWLALTASNSILPAVANEPIDAALLEHGRRQVEYMIKDRPSMGAYRTETGFKLVRPADPFYKWAVRKFAGEDTKSPVFWDASSPATEAEHTPPHDDDVGLIRVSRKIGRDDVGEWKGKEKAFEVLWSQAIFELNNIGGFAAFLELHDRALNGRIERESYIMESAKSEHIAYLKTNTFFRETWVPWAIKVQLTPSAQRFMVAWDMGQNSFDDWISKYTDRTAYPWVPFGEYFDEAKRHREQYGASTGDRVSAVDYWKALQNSQHEVKAPDRP